MRDEICLVSSLLVDYEAITSGHRIYPSCCRLGFQWTNEWANERAAAYAGMMVSTTTGSPVLD